jgi:hypothetical protein
MKPLSYTRKQVRWGQFLLTILSNVVTAMYALPKEAKAVSHSHKALNSDLLVIQK